MELGVCLANFGTCGCFVFIFWPGYLFFWLVGFWLFFLNPALLGATPFIWLSEQWFPDLWRGKLLEPTSFLVSCYSHVKNSSTGVPAAPLQAWSGQPLLQSCEVTCWHCFFQLKAGICSPFSSHFSNFLVCFQEVIFLLSVRVSLVSSLDHHSLVTASESTTFTACFNTIMYFDMLPNGYNSKDQFGG